MRFVARLVLAALALAGCAAGETEDDAEPDELTWASPQVPTDPGKADGARAAQRVYVNFGGARISDCPYPCSDATLDRSWGVRDEFGVDLIELAPFESSSRAAIVERVRTIFARYDVTFTTERPAEGPYTMVVVSSSWAPHHGMAPLDCENQNPSNIAFVQRVNGLSVSLIARYMAHELGHTFGLAHVVEQKDIMHWASSGQVYTRATYDTAHPSEKCMAGMVQDAPAMLESNLGLRIE